MLQWYSIQIDVKKTGAIEHLWWFSTHRVMLKLSQEQRLIQREIRGPSEDYGDEYWREKDREVAYPINFVTDVAENGWLGTSIPRSTAALD